MKRLLSALLVSSLCFVMVGYAQTLDNSVVDEQVEALISVKDETKETVVSREVSKAIKQMIESVYASGVAAEPVEETYAEPVMIKKYEKLYKTNADTVGFIYLTDEYKYPILQRISDQNYYLHKDFFGKEDKNGSIFVNRFSELGKSRISLIYGHTMKSGKMFGSLKNYLDEDYFMEHRVIQIDTLYDEMFYEVVAVAQTSMNEDFKYYDYVGDVSEEEFYDWQYGFERYCTRGSLCVLEYGDTIVELSCCAYHTQNGRLVVILRAVDPNTEVFDLGVGYW